MSDSSRYVLGYAGIEHERLIRQAQRWHAYTEKFFREAGIGTGLRVLDLGSGIGDVAMLIAQIVGPTGEVVGVERDPQSVDVARARASEAGFTNVTFLAAEIAQVPDVEPFDAVAGRFILQFLPDPAAGLRSVSRLLRPNGVVAVQEVAWAPSRAANAHLPLWSACASVVYAAIRRNGANPEVGLALYRIFAQARLPEPELKVDMQMSASRKHLLWPYDLLLSIRAGLPATEDLEGLGDLTTLADRLEAEARGAQSAVASITVIGAASGPG
jgi:ubiquinone/menaquinone biosynthesis C-methylase UbiE